jgi:hypothetical protein
MSRHPCADHPCDHCVICEAGICCQTVSIGQRTQLDADDQAQRDRLRTAIAQDAGTVLSLPGLVRQDARHPRALLASARLGLHLASAADPLSHDCRKEADVHVIPARSK